MKFLILFLVIMVFPMSAVFAEEDVQSKALLYLKDFNTGQYGKMWDEAALTFKNGVTKENWINTAKSVVSQLGRLINRQYYTTQDVILI